MRNKKDDDSIIISLSSSGEADRNVGVMMSLLLPLVCFTCLVMGIDGFRPHSMNRVLMPSTSLSMLSTDVNSFHETVNVLNKLSMFLSDSSVSDDEILVTTGQTSDLPDPAFAIVFAAVLLIGVGALQFSLGDITKEEGQARVKDFLATKRDTERKRGYFD